MSCLLKVFSSVSEDTMLTISIRLCEDCSVDSGSLGLYGTALASFLNEAKRPRRCCAMLLT